MKKIFYFLSCLSVLLIKVKCSKNKGIGQQVNSGQQHAYVVTAAGNLTGFADGASTSARFSGPDGVATDPFANIISVMGITLRLKELIQAET